MFDRHAILKKHYRDEIGAWDWPRIMERFERNAKDEDCCEIEDGDKYVYQFIGSVFSLTPSGKYYMPWTSNQTRADCTRDEAWWAALEEVCEDYDCWPSTPDGADGADIFLCKRYAVPEEEDGSED